MKRLSLILLLSHWTAYSNRYMFKIQFIPFISKKINIWNTIQFIFIVNKPYGYHFMLPSRIDCCAICMVCLSFALMKQEYLFFPRKKNQLLYNRYNILIVNQCSILTTVECVVKSINKVLVECVCVSMCALCVRVLCQQIVKIANCAYYLGCYRHSMLNAWKTNSQLKRRQTYRWYTIVDHFHFG